MTEQERARHEVHEAAEHLAYHEYLCQQKHDELEKLALELSAMRSQFYEKCQLLARLRE